MSSSDSSAEEAPVQAEEQACSQEQSGPAVLEPDPVMLAALMEFSAAAGHEINNPLAVILGRTQLLLQQEKDPSRRQSLETIAGQAWRIRDMIGDLMLFAYPPEPQPRSVLLREVLSQLEKNTYRDACRGQIYQDGSPPTLKIEFCDDLQETTLWADPDQLATVLSELLRNALHPNVRATSVVLSVEQGGSLEKSCVISVRDDGRGLSPTDAVQLFNPFYSGRQAGRGLGFGLCKAWRLATLNSAKLRVVLHGGNPRESKSGESVKQRTEFRVTWPLSQE